MRYASRRIEVGRGQSSLEFIMLAGAMVFFFLLVLSAISEQQETKAAAERRFLVKDTALAVQQELVLAAGARDGYERTFTLPLTLLNQEYTITLVDGLVHVNASAGKEQLALPVPRVQGTLAKGENRIRKQAGTVLLNS